MCCNYRISRTSVAVNGDMRGGMSSTELEFTVGTTSFINYLEPFNDDVKRLFGIANLNYMFISSTVTTGSTTRVSMQVVGPALNSATITTQQASASAGTLTIGGLSVSAITSTARSRTALCFGDHPIAQCVDDPTQTNLLTSREAMTGVHSISPEELETCIGLSCAILPDAISSGILVTFIVTMAFAIFYGAMLFN